MCDRKKKKKTKTTNKQKTENKGILYMQTGTSWVLNDDNCNERFHRKCIKDADTVETDSVVFFFFFFFCFFFVQRTRGLQY